MIEGKTKRGFAYAIAEENVDQEFLDALAEAEDGQPLKVSKAPAAGGRAARKVIRLPAQ